MIKNIFRWIRAAFKAIGRVMGRVFSITVHKKDTEQYVMKKKTKEKMAKNETEAFRLIEDEYLARMKKHGDLANEESDAGDPTRRRILMSEEACKHFDAYKAGMDLYFITLDKEGKDEAFSHVGPAVENLVRYVHYIDAAMGNASSPPDMNAVATAWALATG